MISPTRSIEIPEKNESYSEAEQYSEHDIYNEDEEEANMETSSYAIVKMKNHMSLQLLIVQVLKTFRQLNLVPVSFV
jgi:brefeldin A-inhibited guanine nucleotide-exchange protein